MRITPVLINYNQITRGNSCKKTPPRFVTPNFSGALQNETQISFSPKSPIALSPDWIKDETILKSFNALKELTFNPNDVVYVQSMGAVLPFKSGQEAASFINKSSARIKFDYLPSPSIHAQYDYEDNVIKINEIYKNTDDPAVIFAIAGAILHEAGHAKEKNSSNSVQEEINCLAMNALSQRTFAKKYPELFKDSDDLIVRDGVCVYADLFFDKDADKRLLIQRLKKKYGFLPAGDFEHPPCGIALAVKSE